MFFQMICLVSLLSNNWWRSTTRSRGAFWSSRMMWFGRCLKNLRKSMITTKTNSIKRLEMRWKSGPDLSIGMLVSSRNLIWFALSVANTCLTWLSTQTVLKTTACLIATHIGQKRSQNLISFTKVATGSADQLCVKWTNNNQILEFKEWTRVIILMHVATSSSTRISSSSQFSKSCFLAFLHSSWPNSIVQFVRKKI